MSATSTVLRVKRRLEDNPQDALVLMCKRIKTDSEEVSPSLFVFRGTVNNQENSCIKTAVPKTELKFKSKHDVNDILSKIREERKEVSTENRYEVVNCLRGVKDCNVDDDDAIDLVDLQMKVGDADSDAKYAFDLYTAAKQDFDVSMLDNLVTIENYETDLIFGSYRDNGRLSRSSDEADDDDDSNDENNWRNDYPDSEASSIDEQDMIKAMEKCDIDDSLSSDAEEDKIYNEPLDLFNDDIKRYGAAYAKYKSKVLVENPDLSDSRNLVFCAPLKDDDDKSIEGYKDDDDDGFYYGQDEDSQHFKEQYASDSDSDAYGPD